MDDVANRRYDLANIFADGVKIASEKIGKNSKDFAVHVKGMELPGYEEYAQKTKYRLLPGIW